MAYSDSKKDTLKCEFCGRNGKKESSEDIRSRQFSEDDKIKWLSPDEKWICNSCLKRMAKNIIK